MKVDILMATYNRRTLLPRAIDSVLAQTFSDWDMYVYDDGSDYEFQEIISLYTDPRIHFHCGPRIDPAEKARTCRYAEINNFLISNSGNELVCYLCDDDYYWPEALEHAVAFFERNPDKHVAYGKITNSDAVIERGNVPREKRHVMFIGGTVTTDPTGYMDHCQVIHRRECFEHTTWVTDPEAWPMADAFFFRKLVEKYPFYPLDVYFANRYLHATSLRALIEADNPLSTKREDV